MQRRTWHLMVATAGLAVLVVLGTTLLAQTAPPRQEQDILPALLIEIRGLREAMEQMATSAPRVQLAMGRLQLQEQRVNALLRRQQEIRSSVTRADESLDQTRRQLAGIEQEMRTSPAPAKEQTRRELDEMLKTLRLQLGTFEATSQRLHAEESDVAQQLATDQARWADINQRLEELERALTRK